MKEKWTIDGEQLFEFLSDQLVKKSGAFSKGVNKGLNIARSAIHNIDAVNPLDIETLPLVKELRKKIEELEDQNRRILYENLKLRDNAMYFEKRFYESALNYENAMNQLREYIARAEIAKPIVIHADSAFLETQLANAIAEKDALIKELKNVADETETCHGCKWLYRETNKCINCDSVTNNMWEWRGPQKEE